MIRTALAVYLALLGLRCLLKYWKGGVCKSKKRLDGKRIIVTGTTSGIGYETALDLAKRGSTVIMACRTELSALICRSRMLECSPELKPQQLVAKTLDLASFESIRAFCDEIQAEYTSIDALVCTASIRATKYPGSKTLDGLPLVIGTNYVGNFVLVKLLLPLLLRNKIFPDKGRVIVVSSSKHYQAKSHWNDILELHDGTEYENSMLANVAFCKDLARRNMFQPFITASVNPGLVATDMKNRTLAQYILYPFTKSDFAGAQTILHCLLDDDIVSGAYYSDCARTRESSFATQHFSFQL
ncbi:hypothetical protein Ciccas_011455, partial [Cichlidogyrus casuarinus]